MASDGKLIFDTKIDDSGFKKGIGSLKGIAGKLAKGAVKAVAGVQAALTAAGGAAVKVGSEFEAGMSQVAATMGFTQEQIRGGSKEFKKLESAAREMGATTQFSATEASEALNYIALAGYGADDAIKLLPKTLNLAAAGGLDLGYATDIVTDAMSALGLSIEDADSFIDQMAKTSQKSNTNIGQLGEAILTVGGTAKDLAGGTVELNTALGILANNGIKGAEGGTKLRNVIMSLTAPTDKASKAMQALGITAFDAEGNMRPLQDVFKDISFEMENMTTQEKKEWLNTVFNKQDLAAVSALLAANATNVDDISTALEAAGGPGAEFKENIAALGKEFDAFTSKQDFVNHVMETFGLTAEQAGILYEGLKSSLQGGEWNALAQEIEKSAGAAEEMSKVMIDNLKGDITILKSALEELAISFYQTFSGDLRDSVQMATGYVDNLSLAMRGVNADELKSQLDSAGVSVDDLNINLVEAVLRMDQFDDKAGFVDMAMERWGLSSEQASTLFDTLSQSLENSGNTMQVVGEVLGQTIADIVTNVAEALPQFLEIGIQITQNILNGLAQNLPQISDAAIQIGVMLLEGLGNIAIQFVDIGLRIVENLLTGIGQNAPQILSTVLDIVIQLADTIISHVPSLIEAGAQLLVGLAEGIAQNLPTIIENAPRIINEFTNALIGAIPTLIVAGIQIIAALVKGLVQAIPTLIANIPQIILAIVNVFTLYNWGSVGMKLIEGIGKGISQAPGIIDKAIKSVMENGVKVLTDLAETLWLHGSQLMENLAKGITGGSGSVLSSIGQLIGQFISTIAKGAGKLLGEGVKLIGNLVSGIIQGLPQLAKTAGELIGKFIQSISTKIPEILSKGAEMIGKLAEGIWNGIPSLIEKGPEIVAAIISGIASAAGTLITTGVDIVRNFVSGFKSGASEVEPAARDVSNSAVSGLKSQESAAGETGSSFGNLFNSGLSSTQGEASSNGQAVGNSAVQGLQSGLSSANQTGSQTGSSYAKGIQSTQGTVSSGAKTLADKAKAGLDTGTPPIGNTGSKAGGEYSKQLKSKSGESQSSGKNLADNAVKGAESASSKMKSVGSKAGEQFVAGIKSSVSKAKSVGTEIIKSLAAGMTGSQGQVKQAGTKIVQDCISTIQSKTGEFQNKGQELIKSLSSGMTSASGQVQSAIRNVLQKAVNAGNSYKGQFRSVGRNLASGIAAGIRSGSGAVAAAARSAVQRAVAAAKAAGRIHSPSREMAEKIGQPLTQGIAVGMTEAEQTLLDAMGQISDVMLQKMKESNENLNYEQQKALSERLEEQKQLGISGIGAMYEVYRALHRQGVLDIEKEIAQIEEEIKNVKDKKKKEARVKELEADKELLEQKKKNLEDYSKDFVDKYDGIVDTYQKAMDKIQDKAESLKDKLISYGDVLEKVRDSEGNVVKDKFGNDMLKLTDLDGQIRQVSNYGSLLEQLEARGADAEVMSKMLTMSIDDAVQYGTLLMQQSDREWDHYMDQMESKRKIAEEISKKYYKREVDSLDKNFKNELLKGLEKLPGAASETGQQIADKLAKGLEDNKAGFLNVIDSILAELKNKVANETVKIQAEAQAKVSNQMAKLRNQANNYNITINGANTALMAQARDYGRELMSQIDRERRRYG